MKSENAHTMASRPSRRILPIALALLAAHFILLFLVESMPDRRLPFLYFFFTLVIMPGYISSRIIFPRARRHYTILFSLVLGLALFFAILIVLSVFDLKISSIPYIIPVLTIIVSIYHDRGSHVGMELLENQPLSRPIALLLLVVLVFISIITLVVRDPLLYTGDSPDNMAYIRTIARSQEVFPDQFMYRNGGMLTRDLRRGLLHAMWGTLNAAASEIDVLPVWPFLSWIGSIFVLLGIFCLGIQLFRSQAIGLSGVILYLLFYQGGFAGHQLFINAYSFFFAKAALFAFFAFLLLYLRTRSKIFLLMTVISSFVAVGAHVSYIMILLFIAFIFSLMELIATERDSRMNLFANTIIPLFASIVAVNLPYLFLRYLRDYNPVNEIHTHSQGMLFFTDKLAVVNPILFFQRTGFLMAVSIFAVLILWRRSREDRNLRSTLILVAAVYILAFNPLWVPFIMKRITYLIVRFSVAAPSMLLVAYLVRDLWSRTRGRAGGQSLPLAVLGWIVVIAFLLPGFVSNFTAFAYGGKSRDISEGRSCLALNDLYGEINDHVPAGSVIASDPITSYSLLAFTDQYVVCTFDQHSTPNDSTAIDRIIACRDIYLPGASCHEKIVPIEEYDADYVVINGRLPTDVRSQYWRSDRHSAETAARALSECGGMFHLLYSRDSIHLFEYTGSADSAALFDEVESRASPPFALGEYTDDTGRLLDSGTDGIYIENWGTDTDRISRGDTLRMHVDWVADRRLDPGTYIVYVRFDTDFDKGALYKAAYGKIYRKIVEEMRGERYRFRFDFLPFEGVYPPDRWEPGIVLRDHFNVVVPTYIAEGVYTISVKMDNAPHYSNLVMKDLLRDDDLYDGSDLMEIVIE
jgi:hypothetical protein